MGIRVNKTILKIDEVMAHMDILMILSTINGLKEGREGLLKYKQYLINDAMYFGQNVDELEATNEYLGNLDKNIRTLTLAMECHITKQSEKRLGLGSLQTFFLS